MVAVRSVSSLVCVGALAAVAATGAASSSLSTLKALPAAVQHRHDPVKNKHRRDDGVYESTNWSGYALTGSTFTEADGSWTVPAVSCSAGSTQYSSFWVGIDGFDSNSVEQTGSDSDCSKGTPTYYVWFEFYPHPSYEVVGFSVKPGDVLTATIAYTTSSRTFTTTIANARTGQKYSTSSRVNAQRNSAEWIAEAPSSSGGVLTLANFGTMQFDTANLATSGGSKRALTSYGTNPAGSTTLQDIVMVQSNGGGATPSPTLSTTMPVFTDTYDAPMASSTKKSSKQ